MFGDPAFIDARLKTRAVSFENPTGDKGAGGSTGGGRKGSPSRMIAPGETITLADLEGPGRLRHIWMTVRLRQPEAARALRLEVLYDDLKAPSVSVPMLDFFGLPHGRAVAYDSVLTAVQEGRGFNAYYPMPFDRRVRVTFSNEGADAITLFYQIDYTLGDSGGGYLHAIFRRENPTTQGRDFVIFQGLKGPGRFLGCVVGVRPTPDGMSWWGEGEVKMYLDGDQVLPTIAGTGLEDYVGTAWGLGPHSAPMQGAPMVVAPKGAPSGTGSAFPDFVGFYRWHIADPVLFERDLKVTIQQIGALIVPKGQEATIAALTARHQLIGEGWISGERMGSRGLHAFALAERIDDYCATAFIYLKTPQIVARYLTKDATASLKRLPYEG